MGGQIIMHHSDTSPARRLRSGPTRQPSFQLRIESDLLEKIRARAKTERKAMSVWIRDLAVRELRRKVAAV